MNFEIFLNICFVGIVFFWSAYRAHRTKRKGSRFGYSAISCAALLVILSSFVKDGNILNYKGVSWQTVFLHFSIALYCLINLWQYHLTGEFRQAFIKKKAVDRSTIPNHRPPPPPQRPSPFRHV